MSAHLRISDLVVDDAVLRILTLDHVARRNALTAELLAAIPAALPTSSSSPTQPIRAVILEGAEGTFSSGFDLRAIDGEKHTGVDPITVAADAIAACPVPVVVAVDGACRGGAVELVAACHVRVAAVDATFAVPAVHLGLVYPTSGLRRFRRVMGGAAERVLVVGRAFTADDARAWGLVHDVVADARGHARLLAADIARAAPIAVSGTLRALRAVDDDATDAVIAGFRAAALVSADLVEGVSAANEKRPAKFAGR